MADPMLPPPDGDARAAVVDRVVEGAGRWAAARSTRRSFFARLGRLGVLVAGGPAVATLLADAAGARVCGQTGVSLQCPTFDCDGGVWGWCWYATGCCSDGLLKKICDCCEANYPNVHGYCPTGTNVRCIVESCGTDPRARRATVTRMAVDDRDTVAAHLRNRRFGNGVGTVVLVDGDSPRVSAVGVPLGAVLEAPVLLVPRGGLQPGTAQALDALRPDVVRIVGPELPAALDADLAARGVAVERIGSVADASVLSGEVARWVSERLGPRDVVCVALEGVSEASAPAAAAFASVLRLPLVLGVDTPRAGAGVYFVGPEPQPHPADLLAGPVHRVGGATPVQVAAELALFARRFTTSGGRVVLAPAGAPFLFALAGADAPLLLHEPGALGQPARDFLFRAAGVTSVEVVGVNGALDARGVYEVQSLANGYDAHRLIGVAGQGLPVYEQPLAEREIGRARPGDAPPPARAAPVLRRAVRRVRR